MRQEDKKHRAMIHLPKNSLLGRNSSRVIGRAFFVAIAVLSLTEAGPIASAVAQTSSDTDSEATRKLIAQLRAAILADPKSAEDTMKALMRSNPKVADRIAIAALQAIPKIEGVPDTNKIAQLLKAAVELIYAELGDLKGKVSSVVLAAIEALRGPNGIIEPKAVSVVLSLVLPIIAANDPGMIDPLIKSVLALVPDAEGILNQMLAELFTPLEGAAARLGRRSIQVEPNFINTPPQ